MPREEGILLLPYYSRRIRISFWEEKKISKDKEVERNGKQKLKNEIKISKENLLNIVFVYLFCFIIFFFFASGVCFEWKKLMVKEADRHSGVVDMFGSFSLDPFLLPLMQRQTKHWEEEVSYPVDKRKSPFFMRKLNLNWVYCLCVSKDGDSGGRFISRLVLSFKTKYSVFFSFFFCWNERYWAFY